MSDVVTTRTDLRVGDIGRIVEMHGVLYATEYGWTHAFEAYVAEHLGRFGVRYGSNGRERIWVVERGAEIIGCVAIVEASPDVAQLRWFVVHPAARGEGLGRALLHDAIEFCRASGYKSVVLDTVSDLTAAARLYVAAGLRVTDETHTDRFGGDIVEQRYEMEL